MDIETDYAEVEVPYVPPPPPGKAGCEMTEKICPECGAEFRPLHGPQVCCSDECKRERRRRQVREALARIRKLSPHQRMLANLRRRDALCPKPRTEVICRNGVVIERRGTVPAGCHAADFIRHNA